MVVRVALPVAEGSVTDNDVVVDIVGRVSVVDAVDVNVGRVTVPVDVRVVDCVADNDCVKVSVAVGSV